MDNIETRLKALEYELSQIVDSDYLNELNKYPNQNLRKDIIINIIPSKDISFKTRALLSDILDRLELTRQDRQDLEKYIIYGGGENIEYIKSTIGDLLNRVPELNYLIDNIQTVIPLLNKLDELFKDADENLDSFKELYDTLNSLKTSINSINQKIKNLIEITYTELVNLKNNAKLISGNLYRITDYITTTTQANTQSKGHLFDVIVLALSESKLSEQAWAIQSKRDTDGYFADSKLSAWQIWYCLDNDIDRFAWADTTNGKGVIYRMIDEYNNDCPYDFKNILFKHPIDTATYPLLYYTFSKMDDKNVIDNSLNNSCYGNIIGFHILNEKANLNANVFINTSTIDCYGNSLGINSRNNHFGDGCYYNELGLAAEKNLFGDGCYSNIVGNSFKNNIFGDNCHSNTFGTKCRNNILGKKCYYNTFGTNCFDNTLGQQSYNNVFSNDCYKNTLGSDCTYNTFGVHCPSNTLGDYCTNNRFGSNCGYMLMLSSCVGNVFESGCKNNRLGLGSRYNYFGAECYEVIFGTSKTNVADGYGDGYSHIIFDAGVNRLYLKCSEDFNNIEYVRRYHITSDVYNTTIEVVRNLNKQIQVSKNSEKKVVQFCIADMFDALSQITTSETN